MVEVEGSTGAVDEEAVVAPVEDVVDEEVVTDEEVVVSFALLGMDVKCLRKGFLLCNAPSRLR